jgi:hypothetical protein
MIIDTGKIAGGKPATGRLCQAGLREKASVRHLARLFAFPSRRCRDCAGARHPSGGDYGIPTTDTYQILAFGAQGGNASEELHAARISGKQLLALWNALPGVEKRRKVGDREALVDQSKSTSEKSRSIRLGAQCRTQRRHRSSFVR